MYIDKQEEGGVTLFTVGGRLDAEGASNLKSILQDTVLEGKSQVVLDMAEVRYIGSAGLRTLIDTLTRIRVRGGDLKLVALSRNLLRTFRILGVEEFFSLYDTPEAAMAGF